MTSDQVKRLYPNATTIVLWCETVFPEIYWQVHRTYARTLPLKDLFTVIEKMVRSSEGRDYSKHPECPDPAFVKMLANAFRQTALYQMKTPDFTNYVRGKLGAY